MDVVDKIKAVETGGKPITMNGPGGQKITQTVGDVPNKDVVIESASVE
jgi:hypothetical protein